MFLFVGFVICFIINILAEMYDVIHVLLVGPLIVLSCWIYNSIII